MIIIDYLTMTQTCHYILYLLIMLNVYNANFFIMVDRCGHCKKLAPQVIILLISELCDRNSSYSPDNDDVSCFLGEL